MQHMGRAGKAQMGHFLLGSKTEKKGKMDSAQLRNAKVQKGMKNFTKKNKRAGKRKRLIAQMKRKMLQPISVGKIPKKLFSGLKKVGKFIARDCIGIPPKGVSWMAR